MDGRSRSQLWFVAAVCQSPVEAVTNSLIKVALHYIKFPTDQQSLINNKLSFYSVTRFPNVIGAIDCTHIVIKAPAWYVVSKTCDVLRSLSVMNL